MSSKSRAQISTEINTNFPNNSAGSITAALLRSTTQDITDSSFYMNNDAFIVVPTTGNATTNGTALKAAYTAAAALTPNGNALSRTNRASVILPPGTYDLGSSSGLTLSAFVDVVSLTGNYQDVIVTSAVTASNGFTIGLTSDIDVQIIGITIQNSATTQSSGASTEACAFRFTDGGAGYSCIGCYFVTNSSWPMVQGFECASIFTDCISEDFGFGAHGGEASGVFTRCQGGSDCFGSGANFSGQAISCSGNDRCFGYNGQVRPQAVFRDCVAQQDCFAGGTTGDFDGTAINCSATGGSFGFRLITSNARLYGCKGDANSFGFSGVQAGAVLWDCLGTTGCFGGGVTAGGDFHNCVGSHNCFGTAFAGNAWNCTGGDSCFGRTNGQISGGQFVGKAWGCTAGPDSFGKDNFAGWAWDCAAGDGSFGGGGTMIGYAINCSAGEGSFGHGGAFFGVLDHCWLTKTLGITPLTDSDWVEAWFPVAFGGRVIGTIFSPTGTNKNAVTLPDGATGSFEFCTFRKTGTGIPLGIDTLGTATMSLSYNKFNTTTGWAVGITNNLGILATSFNIGDVDV